MTTPSFTLPAHMPEMRVLGTRVNPLGMEEVMQWMEAWIVRGDQGRFVVASGMHAVMEARRDAAFRSILVHADLFVPDGFSLVWLARRRGFRLQGRVCGTDLLRQFCHRAADRAYRMFFYGDTPHVLSQLQQQLQRSFPALTIAGTYSPPFRPLTPEEDEEIIRLINAAAPDVLWVGLGLPKQERWIAEHRDRLRVPVLVAVGAAFKFVSGTVAKAPPWLGEHGLEWLWRFLHEPRRLWRRALIDVPVFASLALLELGGWRRPSSAPSPGGIAPTRRREDRAS